VFTTTQINQQKTPRLLDFKEFPFGEQILPISIIAFGYTPDEVELVFEGAGSEKKFQLGESIRLSPISNK